MPDSKMNDKQRGLLGGLLRKLESILEEHQVIPPVMFLYNSSDLSLRISEVNTSSTVAKEASMLQARINALQMKADMMLYAGEAWHVRTNAKEHRRMKLEGMTAADHPDREEAIMLMLELPGVQTVVYAPLIRTGKTVTAKMPAVSEFEATTAPVGIGGTLVGVLPQNARR